MSPYGIVASFRRRSFPNTGAIFVILLASALFLSPARADEPDDQYLTIYNAIQLADELNDKGQTESALAKYSQAQKALIAFQHTYPTWNSKLVSYRLSDLSQKITTLTEKTSAPATTNKPAPNSEPGAQATPATAVSGVQVRLLEPGAEPRKPLRLHPKPGDKQSVVMTLKIGMEVGAGQAPGQPIKMPAMKLPMDTTIKNVSADGDISYELVMGDATIADDAGAADPMAQAMKTALASVKGLSGSGVVSSRGLTKSTDIKPPPSADPQLAQSFEQAKNSFEMLSVPFPEEPIGQGAKWEVKRPVKSQGLSIAETSTYELASVDEDHITLRATISQHAANQKIQNAAMPGMKLDLTKMTSKGTGDIKTDLGQLLPNSGTIDFHSDFTMGMNMGTQKQTMAMKMDMNIRLEAK